LLWVESPRDTAGRLSPSHLAQCEELGKTLAGGLALGIF